MWKLNEALSQYDLGRYAKKGAIAPVEDAIEGAIAPVEDAIETPPLKRVNALLTATTSNA